MKNLSSIKILLGTIFLLALPFCQPVVAEDELVRYVRIALAQSDAALDLADEQLFSEMSVAGEEHRFESRLVPLSNVGVVKGVGSQTLGLEVVRATSVGLKLTAGVRGDRTDQSSEYTVENRNSAKAYVKMSQGIFRRWGTKYNLANLNSAQLRMKQQSLSSERSRQELILSTVRKYYQLVLSRQLVTKSEQAWQRYLAHLESARSRHSVGLVSKVDVYRAELEALEAESRLQRQKRESLRAEDDLRDHLGDRDYTVMEVVDVIDRLMPVIPDDWDEALLGNRLDWQAHRIKVKSGKLDVFKAEENLKPDLRVNVTVEQRGEGDSIGEAIDLNDTNWSMQLQLLSGLDFFEEETLLRKSQMQMRKIRREEASLRQRIFRQAREAFDELKDSERSHQISLKRLEQSANALDLTESRYERGLSDNLDVLDSESAYSEAELDAASTLVSYNIASVKLGYVLGVLNVEWLGLSLPQTSRHQNSVSVN